MKGQEPIIGIYKITNPKGKVYIGQSINIYGRWEKYKRYYTHLSQQPKIYNSLMKYTPTNHEFEILEECSLDLLNERETYWKQLYLNKFNGD